MASQGTVQQDIVSHLVADHTIRAASEREQQRIIIDRLELYLGRRVGISLNPSRVHALSTVRRRNPVYLLPPRPPLAISRSAEREALSQSLVAGHVVDLHGLDGSGKSTLASAFIHDLDLNHFPDGAVYVTGRIQFPDLLQALFDTFYESDTPVKISGEHAHVYLANLRVLVVLDDVGLGPQRIDPVLDALTEAAVLIVGSERTALGRGRALRVRGLPRQDAVALFERTLGRTLMTDEPFIVDQICTLLNDLPLSISSVAAQAAHSKQSLTRLFTDLQERKPWAGPGADVSVGPALEQAVLLLDSTERQLLTLLAAFEGQSASRDVLRRMIKLTEADLDERLQRLEVVGLIRAVESSRGDDSTSDTRSADRIFLTQAYSPTVRTWLVDDDTRLQVVNYYTNRLGEGAWLPGDELAGLLGAIDQCARSGWFDQLETLARAADHSLATLRWWAEWQHLLDLTRRASQAAEDRALEAWAIHQLGSVVGALGVFDRAFSLLRTAMNIRGALGDEEGAALAAQNLGVLEHFLPPAHVEPTVVVEDPLEKADSAEAPLAEPAMESVVETAASKAPPERRSRTRLALLAAAVLLLIVMLAVNTLVGYDGVAEQPSDLRVSWEFGDAWNTIEGETWTQQIIILVEGDDREYLFFVNGEPARDVFDLTLPLCDGAAGTIRVETSAGHQAEVEYVFASPYCE